MARHRCAIPTGFHLSRMGFYQHAAPNGANSRGSRFVETPVVEHRHSCLCAGGASLWTAGRVKTQASPALAQKDARLLPEPSICNTAATFTDRNVCAPLSRRHARFSSLILRFRFLLAASKYVLTTNRYVFVANKYMLAANRYVFMGSKYVSAANRYVFATNTYMSVANRYLFAASRERFPRPRRHFPNFPFPLGTPIQHSTTNTLQAL